MPSGLVGPKRLAKRAEACEHVTEGVVLTRGKRAERAIRTAALASRNCASACCTFWLEMFTCSSRALSAGSLKISHHLPRSTPSLGCASFQPGGGASLKCAGPPPDGRWHPRTLTHPGDTTPTTSKSRKRVRSVL